MDGLDNLIRAAAQCDPRPGPKYADLVKLGPGSGCPIVVAMVCALPNQNGRRSDRCFNMITLLPVYFPPCQVLVI